MLKPNRNILLREGCQWDLFPSSKSMVHYTNYRVNPVISKDNVEAIEYLRDRDPAKYDVTGIGLPGVPEGGVYSHLLKHVSRLTQPVKTFSLGLDWGFKHYPLTVILLGSQATSDNRTSYQDVNALEELQITNYSRFSHQDLAYQIVRWIRAQGIIYPTLFMREPVVVYCDKSNLTWIEMLNTTAREMGIRELIFTPAPQMEVEWRIKGKQPYSLREMISTVTLLRN